MATKIEIFNQTQLKKDLPDIRPGDTVRVYQKIREGDKERIQVFEGVVLARKHGKGVSATITVRKDFSGIGVERVFPIHSPVIDRFEVEKRGKVRRAKIYYLRTAKGDRVKLKKRKISAAAAGESRREDAEEKKE